MEDIQLTIDKHDQQKDNSDSSSPTSTLDSFIKNGYLVSDTKLVIQESAPDDPTDEIRCRICLESSSSGELIEPCKCKGSIAHVHTSCIKKAILFSSKKSENLIKCEICNCPYKISIVVSNKLDCNFPEETQSFNAQIIALISISLVSLYAFSVTFAAIISLVSSNSDEGFVIGLLVCVMMLLLVLIICAAWQTTSIIKHKCIRKTATWVIHSQSEQSITDNVMTLCRLEELLESACE